MTPPIIGCIRTRIEGHEEIIKRLEMRCSTHSIPFVVLIQTTFIYFLPVFHFIMTKDNRHNGEDMNERTKFT